MFLFDIITKICGKNMDNAFPLSNNDTIDMIK